MTEPTPNAPAPAPAQDDGIGLFGLFGILIGGGCMLMSVAGLINTIFDLELSLRVYGSRTELPDNYETCAGLAAFGILLIGLSFFGSFVMRKFKEAKGKPLVRIAIVVGAVVLLVVAGRGLQVAALVNTYGSMLAYYSTDGDLEDVKAELAKDPSREDLDQAVGRAAQYDNVGALKLLLEHGADLRDSTSGEYKRCALSSVGPEFVKVALDHGVTPETCPDPKEVVWDAVRSHQDDDEKAAQVVTMLIEAGWPKVTSPEFAKDETPLDFAQERGMKKTAKAIEETEAKPRKKKKKGKKKGSKKDKKEKKKDKKDKKPSNEDTEAP